MIKKILIVCLLLIIIAQAFTQAKGFGMGIMLGEPTGINLKLWADQTSAFDLGLAWSFYELVNLHIHGDYIIHFLNPFPELISGLHFYAGFGLRINVSPRIDNIAFGIRIPLGMVYFFPSFPIDVFLEIAPGLDLLLETRFRGEAVVGIRYFL